MLVLLLSFGVVMLFLSLVYIYVNLFVSLNKVTVEVLFAEFVDGDKGWIKISEIICFKNLTFWMKYAARLSNIILAIYNEISYHKYLIFKIFKISRITYYYLFFYSVLRTIFSIWAFSLHNRVSIYWMNNISL